MVNDRPRSVKVTAIQENDIDGHVVRLLICWTFLTVLHPAFCVLYARETFLRQEASYSYQAISNFNRKMRSRLSA